MDYYTLYKKYKYKYRLKGGVKSECLKYHQDIEKCLETYPCLYNPEKKKCYKKRDVKRLDG